MTINQTAVTAVGIALLMTPQGCKSEPTLYAKLSESGPEQVKALDRILAAPTQYSCMILLTAAKAALQLDRIEDSAFLLYTGQMRARFDRECFPPKGQGGNDPFLAIGAMSNVLGGVINPKVMAQPASYAKVMERLKGWTPEVPAGYQPDYDYENKRTPQDAWAKVGPKQTEFISHMTSMSVLLNDPEYFTFFKVVQAASGLQPGTKPSEEERDKALDAMLKIESAKGLKGFASMYPR